MGYLSCKKQDSQPEEPAPVVIPRPEGKFVASQMLRVDKPVMYTRHDVITDIQYIKDFLQRDTIIPFPWPQSIDDGFIFDQLTQPFDMGIEMNFGSQDSVKISFTNLIGEPYPSPVAKVFSILNDSTVVLKDTGISILYSYLTNDTKLIELRHKLEKANNNESFVYYTHQYGANGSGKYNFSLIYRDGKFYMPVIRYRFSLRGDNPLNPSRNISANGNSWILFNPGVKNFFNAQDTIVVQTKWAELVR